MAQRNRNVNSPRGIRILASALLALAMAITACLGSEPPPTPDPWLDIFRRMESVDDGFKSAKIELLLVQRLVKTHQNPECLERYEPIEVYLSVMERRESENNTNKELGLYISARHEDPELLEHLQAMTALDEEFLATTDSLINKMLNYGEANQCWPSIPRRSPNDSRNRVRGKEEGGSRELPPLE